MPNIGEPQSSLSATEDTTYTTAQPNADLTPGTVNNDLLDVVATQLASVYTTLESERETASLKNVVNFTPDAISSIALNWGVLVNQATPNTGNVLFQAKVIPSYPISIPINTIVQTQPFSNQSVIQYFVTKNLSFSTLTATFNPITQYYELTVPVQAVLPGTAYNVGVHALTVLPNNIQGINAIDNRTSINNATDIDTNTQVGQNILNATNEINLGTATGYETLITNNFQNQVNGIAVIGPFSPSNLRVQYDNEIDIAVITTDAVSFTTTLVTQGTPNTLFTNTRPVLSVSSVVGTTTGYYYKPGIDYGFFHDTGPVYGYSSVSFDALTWFNSPPPGGGLQLTVQGTYDGVVNNIQNFIDNPTRQFPTSDILIKKAQPVLIDITVNVASISGTDATTLQTNVIAAIVDALNDYSLGENVDQDNIVDIINSVSGVGSVQIPFTLMQSETNPGNTQSITILLSQFASPGKIIVNVT